MKFTMLYWSIRRIIHSTILKTINKGKSSEYIFSKYFHKNHWGNNETKSGEGSTMEYTKPIRHSLPLLASRIKISSILDAPCGDFNWFKEINFNQEVEYIGGDIVPALISDLNKKFATDRRKFIALNVIAEDLPHADLWLCRDLILHVPNSEIFKIIQNFLNSKIKYLLISSHVAPGIENTDTFMGGSRRVDLLKAPFLLPEPQERLEDYIPGFPERYLMLYTYEALKTWSERSSK